MNLIHFKTIKNDYNQFQEPNFTAILNSCYKTLKNIE